MKTTALAVASLAAMLIGSAAQAQLTLRTQAADPLRPVIGNLALDLNPQADKCYDIVNGVKVEVPCPDVIVAKPDNNQNPSSQSIAAMLGQRQVASRSAVGNIAAEVPVEEGSYVCYNERPPNSGYFVEVPCPDIIVITTND